MFLLQVSNVVWWWVNIFKTLLDVFLLSSNLAVYMYQKRKRQRVRPLCGINLLSRQIDMVLLYITLTWAGCVAYLSGRLAKAWWRGKLQYDSHVFFSIHSGKGSRRIQHYLLMQWRIFMKALLLLCMKLSLNKVLPHQPNPLRQIRNKVGTR